MKTLENLSIVVPFFNEAENIVATVRAIRDAFDPRVGRYEAILVDDGSMDDTGRIADDLARGDARLRVIHHPSNLGYGAALLSGFTAAHHELIFYTDGDLQFDLTEFDRLVPLLERADIVTGYRGNRRDPWYRRTNAAMYNRVVRTLFGVKVTDLDCAFKIYRKSMFTRIRAQSSGIFITGDILIQATRLGLTIGEVEVTHYPRTRGTPIGNHPKVVLTAMLELTRFCAGHLRRGGPLMRRSGRGVCPGADRSGVASSATAGDRSA
jgi:glycosyltransferase involved in cell wall biosynthesis